MVFDPKVNRNSKDGIGDPADVAAVNSTDANTIVALLKGMLSSLLSGVAVTPSQTDDAAFTVATSKVQPVAGTYRSSRDAVDSGDAGALAMTATRALYISPESPAGDSLVDDTNDRLNVGLIASQNGIEGNAGAASAKTVRTVLASDSPEIALLGAVAETAPATDTASSGLNGRLQRIAQRITSLIALVPASLGQKAMASAFAVSIASDQSAIPTQPGATSASGGITTTTRLLSAAATTNATNAKGSAGRLYSIQGYNAAASVRYLKLYNKATAPTVGSDTPVKTIAIPATTAFALDWPVGYYFSTGIAFALTTGSADADTAALTSGDVLGLNLDYV